MRIGRSRGNVRHRQKVIALDDKHRRQNDEMLREETENERTDYSRVVRTDCRVINNNHKGSNYSDLGRKYSDKKLRKRKEVFVETTEDEAENEEREISQRDQNGEENIQIKEVNINREKEEEKLKNKYKQNNIRTEECAICHIIIEDTNLGGSIVDSKQNSHCSEDYLLCQHCVNRFSNRSDIKQPQITPRRSHANFAHGRDKDRDGSKRTYNSPMYLQSPTVDPSGTRCDKWPCGNLEQPNETINYYTDAVSYIVDGNRDDPREERGTERECGRSTMSKCRQHHSCCNLTTRKNDTDQYGTEIKVKSLTPADCSRRPIRCPRLDCSVNVAFSALTHHFLFDHPEVPILSVEPGIESTLIVSYEALSCNSSRCLALLLVSGKLSDSAARLFGGNQINAKYRNRLPLPVLAARLHNDCYACCTETRAGGEGQCEKDLIIAWVAGLNVGDTPDPLRCSIQAVDSIENGGFRSLTYTGPVTSLRTTQCPRDVFLAGDCIVLHEGLIDHITSGCTSLNVNVVVH